MSFPRDSKDPVGKRTMFFKLKRVQTQDPGVDRAAGATALASKDLIERHGEERVSPEKE